MTSDTLALLRTGIELVKQPMFVVVVRTNGGFRFAPTNAGHAKATGVESAALSERAPEDVLPPRLAETACANCARCVSGGGETPYEEIPELRIGRSGG